MNTALQLTLPPRIRRDNKSGHLQADFRAFVASGLVPGLASRVTLFSPEAPAWPKAPTGRFLQDIHRARTEHEAFEFARALLRHHSRGTIAADWPNPFPEVPADEPYQRESGGVIRLHPVPTPPEPEPAASPAPKRRPRRPPAQPYQFTAGDFPKAAGAADSWQLPERLVADGTFARWGASMGYVSSVLFPLALLAWRADPESGWTRWQDAAVEWLSGLVGEDEETVRRKLTALHDAGFLERRIFRDPETGHQRNQVRLAASIFRTGAERYHYLPAAWAFGGWFAVLPSPALRHALLAVRVAEAIRNPGAYSDAIEWDGGEADERMEEQRGRRAPPSWRAWAKLGGFSRSTVQDALPRLARASFGEVRILDSGEWEDAEGEALGRTWYAVSLDLERRQVWPERMNDPGERARLRARCFP